MKISIRLVVPFAVALSIVSFLLGSLVPNAGPATTIAAVPKQTPTGDRKVNARYLQNRDANDFMPTEQAGQFLAADTASSFMPTTQANQFVPIASQAGIARAGAQIYCRFPFYYTEGHFQVGGGEIPVEPPGGPEYSEANPRLCPVSFGFDLSNAIIVVTAGNGAIVSYGTEGNVLHLNMVDNASTKDTRYTVLIY